MARVTVEDCLAKVDSRFSLVLLAAKRARQLATGNIEPTVPAGNDKFTVIALREIAAGTVTPDIIEALEKQYAAGVGMSNRRTETFIDEPFADLFPMISEHPQSVANEDFDSE